MAPKVPAKKYPTTGMQQEATVRIIQAIAAVVAVPRVFKVGDAAGNGAGEGNGVGKAGGNDAFIFNHLKCPILRSSPNISEQDGPSRTSPGRGDVDKRGLFSDLFWHRRF